MGAKNRRGLTLLELILSLALASILLVAIGMAVDVHMRTLDSSRTQVEEAQLARVILRHIADDLHAAIVYEPFDTSGTEGLPEGGLMGMAAGAAGLGSDADLDALLGGSSGGGSGSSDNSQGGDDATFDGAISGSIRPPVVPGLYGNLYELQLDVSRLPRVDQYQPMLAATGNRTNIPSDVKTVAYFVAGGMFGQVAGMDPLGMSMTGLYRRELDRAVTQWAAETGGLDTLNTTAELLAPEVVGIEFQYFDGMGWRLDWNSDLQGSLPVAVKITLGLRAIGAGDPRAAADMGGIVTTSMDLAATEVLYYELVVHLPTAKPAQQVVSEMEALGL